LLWIKGAQRTVLTVHGQHDPPVCARLSPRAIHIVVAHLSEFAVPFVVREFIERFELAKHGSKEVFLKSFGGGILVGAPLSPGTAVGRRD
jgi:hypothetical protein